MKQERPDPSCEAIVELVKVLKASHVQAMAELEINS